MCFLHQFGNVGIADGKRRHFASIGHSWTAYRRERMACRSSNAQEWNLFSRCRWRHEGAERLLRCCPSVGACCADCGSKLRKWPHRLFHWRYRIRIDIEWRWTTMCASLFRKYDLIAFTDGTWLSTYRRFLHSNKARSSVLCCCRLLRVHRQLSYLYS